MIEYLIFAWWPSLPPSACTAARIPALAGLWPQLDAFARWLEPREQRMNRYRFKAANGLFGAAQSINRLPLFGSKHQVVMIEQLRMAIMSESIRSASSAEMIRPPCKCRAFLRHKERLRPIRPTSRKSAVMTA
jgi:hypothetical protein